MIGVLMRHLRANAVAYLALFVALGGTGYAATDLRPGSVRTRDLRNGAVTAAKLANHSVTPAKLSRKTIAGSVRHWADVEATGAVSSSSSRARVKGSPANGGYAISWGDTFSHRCAAIATPTGSAFLVGSSAGYTSTRIEGARPTLVIVDTYNSAGQPTPAGFSLVVIC